MAFYPTDLPDQPRAPGLGNRDVFGELARNAREDGLEVVARLSLRGSSDLLAKHPEWANVDATGRPLPTACMNGGYFHEYGASVVREIAARYRPSAFTLSGWGVNYNLCYCQTCCSLFHDATGRDVPSARDWDDPHYHRWMDWNNERVMALWDHGNRIAREAGGPDCLWIGQLLGSFLTRNLRALSERAPLLMIDHQAAEDESGVMDNGVFGKTACGLRGWKRPVAVATALYSPRMNSPRPEEIAMWVAQGTAAGVQPWWNVIGGYTEDRRRFAILPALYQWHARNEPYLFDRVPIASVGLVWSDTNNLYYGRDEFAELVRLPWQGMVNALTRAGIPFVVIHADDIDRDSTNLAALVLPDIAAMSEPQVEAVRRFSARGGGVMATGRTSLHDARGALRTDFALRDLFGASNVSPEPVPRDQPSGTERLLQNQLRQMQTAGAYVPVELARSSRSLQTFLRLTPELGTSVYGPQRPAPTKSPPDAVRHPALRGFDATDLIYFGGRLAPLSIASDASVLLTFVPPILDTQPERAVFTQTHTDIAGLVVRDPAEGGRVAFLPAGIDRLYGERNLPDHGDLLANLVRWTARDDIPLHIDTRGLFDVSLYRQASRLIVHIADLNNAAVWHKPFDSFAPSAPVTLRVKLPNGVQGAAARLLVSDLAVPIALEDGWGRMTIPAITGYEVIVIS